MSKDDMIGLAISIFLFGMAIGFGLCAYLIEGSWK